MCPRTPLCDDVDALAAAAAAAVVGYVGVVVVRSRTHRVLRIHQAPQGRIRRNLHRAILHLQDHQDRSLVLRGRKTERGEAAVWLQHRCRDILLSKFLGCARLHQHWSRTPTWCCDPGCLCDGFDCQSAAALASPPEPSPPQELQKAT